MSTPQDPNPNAQPQEPTPAYAASMPPAPQEQPQPQQGYTQPTVQLPAPGAPTPQSAPGYPAPGQPGQPAPAYGQAPYPGAPAMAPRKNTALQGTTLGNTNTFAFLAILLAFIAPVAGIVFGHMGLSQIKRTGDSGRGIALTGLIIGYAWFAFLAIFMVIYIGFIVMVVGLTTDSLQSYSY